MENRQVAKSRREQQIEAELQMLKAQLAETTAAGKVQTAPAVGASADRLKEPTKTVQRQGVDSHFFTPILKEGINEKEPRKNIAEDTLKSGLTKPQVMAIFYVSFCKNNGASTRRSDEF